LGGLYIFFASNFYRRVVRSTAHSS
jgi:hypothetical protein